MPTAKAAALAVALLALSAEAPRRAVAAEVLARHPHGAYLENLAVARDGSVFYTSYFDKQVLVWREGEGARAFADLPLLAVNVLEREDGSLLALGHGVPFTEGVERLRGTNRLLVFDRATGAVRRTIALPGVVFGNGMAALGESRALIADSAAGRIWSVDLAGGAVQPWLDHPLFAADPRRPLAPSVNGLRFAGGALLVSNSASAKLMRVRLDGRGAPAGAPEAVADLPGIDDFAPAANGDVFLATDGHDVLRLAPDGTATKLLSEGVDGNTAVALSGDGASLYVLGTGGLFEGGKGEAALVRVPLRP